VSGRGSKADRDRRVVALAAGDAVVARGRSRLRALADE